MRGGACACGAVRYALTGTPLFVHCCHCTDCQRQTGSAFAVNAICETQHVVVETGEVHGIDVPSPSGRGHKIFRCTKCETALWSEFGGRAPLLFLRVTTLDEPAAFPPGANIFVRSKLPWVRLEDDIPVFERRYEREKVWPAKSLARLQAIII